MRRRPLLAAAGAALALPARAEEWPSRTVTVVCPYPPGGQPDLMARLVAERMSRVFGQRFVVENRLGGGGNVATTYVANAAPDGYTLIVGSVASHGINAALYPNLPHDILRDFRHVALLAFGPNVLFVHRDVPATTLAEFVAHARANPGKLSFASPGAGTLNRLVMEMIKRQFGLDIVAVPYRGAGPAANDVIAGHVPCAVINIETVYQSILEGRLRGLAISAPQRSALLPAVPTYAELGYPQLTANVWAALFAPARTPEAIVQRLNQEVRKALREPEVVRTLAAVGATAPDATPEETYAFVRDEIARFRDLVRAVGITPEEG